VPAAQLQSWIERLASAGIPPAIPEEARCVRIEKGKPRFGEEITSRFLGPEINLPDAIATNKGCYLGQEVVERVRSRNLLTRVLVPVTMPADARIAAGVKLLSDERRVGDILSLSCSPRNGALSGIACVALPMASPGTILRSNDDPGCEVTVGSPGTALRA
jgi:aminomethyltransferase